jgi:hypothetical protein
MAVYLVIGCMVRNIQAHLLISHVMKGTSSMARSSQTAVQMRLMGTEKPYATAAPMVRLHL